MVDQLSSFAAEVTRVAKEVGTEGKPGRPGSGRGRVRDVEGAHREREPDGVVSLTTQVRAIADVSTAVTQGDLTRTITVAAQGEVAELKDKINQMIANLAETTMTNQEQDWLKTNLAKISGMMQGQRDLQTVTRLIMSELTPTVSAQHGAFFLAEQANSDDEAARLKLKATYGYKMRKNVSNEFKVGEGLVGQSAIEKKTILITQAPDDYIKVTSGLGESAPVNIMVLPIVFEDQILGVIELGSFRPFSEINQQFLEQLIETIGVVLNTIIANMRTEELLAESQRLTRELQSQSEELQTQQEELQQTNEELQEKAALLAEQNRNIEIKNREIELARTRLEEKAQQLALSSKYKSEFLANMSHELRTPLNSLLILAKMLGDNDQGNLTDKQIEFATTIHNSGNDLLNLINDILDVSKVEAGKMDVHPAEVSLSNVAKDLEQSFGPVAEQKSLDYKVKVVRSAPARIFTDEQRFQQILNNLLSNAFKFTNEGGVTVNVRKAPKDTRYLTDSLVGREDMIAIEVTDTGIGIPADKLQLIFEAFQQADGTTSRRFGGTGLGLSISREIARLLGGEIQVRSESGKGSTFTLYLPARYEPIELPASAEMPELAAVGAGSGSIAGFPELDAALGEAQPEAEEEAILLIPNDLGDDRDSLDPSDKVLLLMQGDEAGARYWQQQARSIGFKTLGATNGDVGLSLMREFRPDAVLIDADLPGISGMVVLTRLKMDPSTRHIPVYVATEQADRQTAIKAGAAACVDKPVTPELLQSVLRAASYFVEREVANLLIIEDDETQRRSMAELIGAGEDVAVTGVGSSEEALAALDETHFDCVVLDLKLPDMTGFEMLEKLKNDVRFRDLPVIVYTGTELTRRDETKLRKYAQTIIVKDANSPERLLEETSLHLHRAASQLPVDKRNVIEQLHRADEVFRDKRVLVVDDDVRNVFALTSILETRGMNVLYAENGIDALNMLSETPEIDIILMDIMMPEMDGYETTRRIRVDERFAGLPIIALTAKAMKGDREKSIAAGASDYIPKPVDADQLMSLMRVWLYR